MVNRYSRHCFSMEENWIWVLNNLKKWFLEAGTYEVIWGSGLIYRMSARWEHRSRQLAHYDFLLNLSVFDRFSRRDFLKLGTFRLNPRTVAEWHFPKVATRFVVTMSWNRTARGCRLRRLARTGSGDVVPTSSGCPSDLAWKGLEFCCFWKSHSQEIVAEITVFRDGKWLR